VDRYKTDLVLMQWVRWCVVCSRDAAEEDESQLQVDVGLEYEWGSQESGASRRTDTARNREDGKGTSRGTRKKLSSTVACTW
jgi:hypothetical protein